MDESTPLTSNLSLSTLAVTKLNKGVLSFRSSNQSFSLRERQRALSEAGVGQAAHLCRDGETTNVLIDEVVIRNIAINSALAVFRSKLFLSIFSRFGISGCSVRWLL